MEMDSNDRMLEGETKSMSSREHNGVLVRVSSALGSGKRETASRSPHVAKSYCGDNTDLEYGSLPKKGEKLLQCCRPVMIPNQALISGFAYCLSSCSMILINKYVLSGFNFSAGISLMLYQNFVSVVIVSLLSTLGMISTEPLTWRLIRIWFPVNVIFVGMLTTSIFSLKFINVAMVTVLKNVANVMTAIGETYLFNKRHGMKVWTALFLMIISAISGGATDLSFHAVGYTWQILNCFLTASYSLTLRRVMDVAKQATKSGNLNEFSMVLLNNVLSLPLGILLTPTFEDADILAGDYIEWASRPCYQLHFNVVSSPDKRYYLQPRGIAQQDSAVSRWNTCVQSINELSESVEHSYWSFSWCLLR